MPEQPLRIETNESLVVFTDLDGTLLDSDTYSFEPAREALAELEARKIPLVVVSSKTRAEIEAIRLRLRNPHPFIVENGGAIVIPEQYFPFPLTGAIVRSPYHIVALGTPYQALRATLHELQQEFGTKLKGYGDMSVEEIAARTGLSPDNARLSQQREYDEPFVIEDPACPEERLVEAITARGLRHTKGGRFHHLTGPHDKGRAVRYLIDCYRRRSGRGHAALITVGLGDSLNDLPMFEAVDRPILVQLTDGSYEPGITLPRLFHTAGPGPIGWNRAILLLLTCGID